MNEVKVTKEASETEVITENPEKVSAKKGKPAKSAKEPFILFNREDASKWLPYTLFVFVLVVLYISVQQFAERTVRNTEKINREIKELRSEYLSTKAELMKERMQTDIAKKLEGTGLKELREPARKLKIEKLK